MISRIVKRMNKNIDFDIASNPEFLSEGSAVNDFMNPDRIVVGVENHQATAIMKRIYNDYIFPNVPIIFTTLETSEMVKYASNAFLAAKVGYINEIAGICELFKADINIVSKAIGLDKRIGVKFLNPGPGFGGSCLPKDVKTLIKLSSDAGYKPQIIESVIESNNYQRRKTLRMIKNMVGEFQDKTFAILGLSFKSETDDIREAPSIFITKAILNGNGKVRVYDPKAMNNMKKSHPELAVEYCENEYSACEGSDCIIFATEWEQFRRLNFERIKKQSGLPVIIDLKNIFQPKFIKDKGFLYRGMGKQ
jgi:UDPglucose 6-dehydrogenase